MATANHVQGNDGRSRFADPCKSAEAKRNLLNEHWKRDRGIAFTRRESNERLACAFVWTADGIRLLATHSVSGGVMVWNRSGRHAAYDC